METVISYKVGYKTNFFNLSQYLTWLTSSAMSCSLNYSDCVY